MCLLKPVFGIKKTTFSAKSDILSAKCTEVGGVVGCLPIQDLFLKKYFFLFSTLIK